MVNSYSVVRMDGRRESHDGVIVTNYEGTGMTVLITPETVTDSADVIQVRDYTRL